MSGIEITLNSAQISHVVRTAAPSGLVDRLDTELGDHWLHHRLTRMLSADRYSLGTVRALLTLLAIPKHDEGAAIRTLAKQLGLAPSTTRRYVNTWQALEMVDRDPDTQRYRRTSKSDRKHRARRGRP